MRPFRDSDDEVDIIWYPAAPDAPVLGYPSRIQQLDNVNWPWMAEGVGEVFDTPRPFVNRKVIPFLPLNHVCGTAEDFEQGGTRNASLPPVLYDRNQIPICCGPPFLGQGGAVGTGTATVTVTVPSSCGIPGGTTMNYSDTVGRSGTTVWALGTYPYPPISGFGWALVPLTGGQWALLNCDVGLEGWLMFSTPPVFGLGFSATSSTPTSFTVTFPGGFPAFGFPPGGSFTWSW